MIDRNDTAGMESHAPVESVLRNAAGFEPETSMPEGFVFQALQSATDSAPFVIRRNRTVLGFGMLAVAGVLAFAWLSANGKPIADPREMADAREPALARNPGVLAGSTPSNLQVASRPKTNSNESSRKAVAPKADKRKPRRVRKQSEDLRNRLALGDPSRKHHEIKQRSLWTIETVRSQQMGSYDTGLAVQLAQDADGNQVAVLMPAVYLNPMEQGSTVSAVHASSSPYPEVSANTVSSPTPDATLTSGSPHSVSNPSSSNEENK